jgi:CRISPR type I-E-associated protein CasB/Cse2
MNLFTDDFRDAVLRWHARLYGTKATSGGGEASPAAASLPENGSTREGRKGDKGMLADMRRSRTVGDALVTEAFSAFLSTICPEHDERRELLRDERALAGLARAALVVARAESVDRGASFGTQMASPRNERPTVPMGLAKAFFQTEDPDLALDQMIRFAAMLDGRFNPVDLARRAAIWDEKTRSRLALDYYDTIARLGLKNPLSQEKSK